MKKHYVDIRLSVNATNVSKSDGRYVIKDVVHAIDGIVLNQRLYTGSELAKSVAGLEGKPAPAGHPKDSKGRHISASNGEALAAAWIGAYCTNSRYEGGRAMCDIVINEAQAKAMPAGAEVLRRLDAAIDGTDVTPIAVSSGLLLREVAANGESRGKAYRAVATDMDFDHLAILLNETPAGTPEEGIGMFVNSSGEEGEVEVVRLDTAPQDKRFDGIKGWLVKLLTNEADISFDQIREGLYQGLPDDGAWVREVYRSHFIWSDRNDRLWKQGYTVADDGSLALGSQIEEVKRTIDYQPITNSNEVDPVKDKILAALNAAGIATAGLDDAQLLSAYNSLVTKPVEEKLNASNSKVLEFEANAAKVADKELTDLATELAVNSTLTVDDLKKLGIERLKEFKANAQAAPVVAAPTGGAKESEFKGYSINAHLNEGA